MQKVGQTKNISKTLVESKRIAPEEFLTTAELMDMLKIKHRQTVYDLIKDGMPSITVGRSYRFIKAEVINFLRKPRVR